MLFNRREAPTLLETVRVSVWPRRSWERSLKYVLLRLMRVKATPHQLALGCAIGVFAAITPFVGLQMLLAGLLALALRASFAAAMLGSFFGNPITWAALWPATYATGNWLLGTPASSHGFDLAAKFDALWMAVGDLSLEMVGAAFSLVWPFVKPMAVGTLPIGILVASLFYFAFLRAASAYQLRRRRGHGASQGPYHPLGDFLGTYDPAHS